MNILTILQFDCITSFDIKLHITDFVTIFVITEGDLIERVETSIICLSQESHMRTYIRLTCISSHWLISHLSLDLFVGVCTKPIIDNNYTGPQKKVLCVE